MLVNSIVNHKVTLSDGVTKVDLAPLAIVDIPDNFYNLALAVDGVYLNIAKEPENDRLQSTTKKRRSHKSGDETTGRDVDLRVLETADRNFDWS